jgi:predicted Zn-dependent protease
MPGRAFSADQRPQHGEGRALIDIPQVIDRALALSRADACIVIGRRQAATNIRWANNTVTTNGIVDVHVLSVVSVIGRRVATVTRTHVPPEHIEEIVRESEAACARKPEAPDYMPLVESGSGSSDWEAPAEPIDAGSLRVFVPQLAAMFERARASSVLTFGYADHSMSTVWLAMSTGLRQRYSDTIGRIAVTAKSPDFSRSAWISRTTRGLTDIDAGALFGTLEQRLIWSKRRIQKPAGHYEVLFEPSCTADLALAAYSFMTRREADEGRNPFSRPSGGSRLGERLFGSLTMYSDPNELDIPATPFHVCANSEEASSVFDNGLPTARTEWVRDGVLTALVTPRYWAVKVGAAPAPHMNNLIVSGNGSGLDQMIAETKSGLLVTSLWYIRTVDPQTALMTGLTRDGVFLIEDGEVRGAVNNFRWNMSPINALAQAVQIGGDVSSAPREYDDLPRAKAPPVRVERFHMSSVSEAS